MARPHYRLEAWRAARVLVKRVYEITSAYPSQETYGLVAQLRRAAVSIPSNLAEGAARAGQREFAQFVNIASGSLSELETQLLLSADLGYLDPNHEIFSDVDQVSALLQGLYRSLAK